MSCKCKNIIENFQGGTIPLNTTFLRDVDVLGNIYSGGTNLLDIFSGSTGGGAFTGNTSGTCINDLYVSNIYGCSPLTIGTELVVSGDSFFGGSILSGGTNLLDIFPTSNTFVTGGTVNNGILTLERNDSNSIQINRVNSGFFSQTGDSTTVTDTTDETTLLGSGVGSLSVLANTFQIGDSYALNIGGKLRTNNAGQTITIRVDAISGSSRVEIATSGVISLDNINALRDFVLEVDFTIRNTGGPGTASLMTSGYFDYVKNNGDLEGVLFSSLESTNFDTTVTKTLDVTVEWGAASTDNQIYSHIAILRKIF